MSTLKVTQIKTLGDVLQARTVQVVEATPYTTYTSTSTTIPYDDTIPQNTEGVELVTATITPTSATNRLRIEALLPVVDGSAAMFLCAAIFQDSTANALAAGVSSPAGATYPTQISVVHEMAAGTTSATTFKLRYGPGVAGTMYVNGSSAGRRFGGISAVRIRVTEIAA